MLRRILENLEQAQGYVNTLRSEIDDPTKQGPGTPREVWKAQTEQLQADLEDLRSLLSSMRPMEQHDE